MNAGLEMLREELRQQLGIVCTLKDGRWVFCIDDLRKLLLNATLRASPAKVD